MSKGTEIIRGFEWEIERDPFNSYYLATCKGLSLTVDGNTWEEIMETIDEICDDLEKEFGDLESYHKEVLKLNPS